jgi:hypothetical protein
MLVHNYTYTARPPRRLGSSCAGQSPLLHCPGGRCPALAVTLATAALPANAAAQPQRGDSGYTTCARDAAGGSQRRAAAPAAGALAPGCCAAWRDGRALHAAPRRLTCRTRTAWTRSRWVPWCRSCLRAGGGSGGGAGGGRGSSSPKGGGRAASGWQSAASQGGAARARAAWPQAMRATLSPSSKLQNATSVGENVR